MNKTPNHSEERESTRVAGLDRILGGGFLRGTVNLIVGPPGTGKTVVAAQMAFAQAAAGHAALYVSHYGETHHRWFANLSSMSFFDPTAIGQRIHLLNSRALVAKEGPAAIVSLVRDQTRKHGPRLVVIDAMVFSSLTPGFDANVKEVVQSLAAHAVASGIVILLLGTDADALGVAAAESVVDGLFRFLVQRVQLRSSRELEVLKHRGSAPLSGRHAYTIGENGLSFLPRPELVLGVGAPAASVDRVASGLPELDAMLRGGWPRLSATLVLGAAGSGKTSMGLKFILAGLERGEPGVVLSAFESPPELHQVAHGLGAELAGAELLWRPDGDYLVDAVLSELIDAVERANAQRVFIDGLSAFRNMAFQEERSTAIVSALRRELRTRGVTAMWSEETHEPQGPDIRLPLRSVSAIADNILLLHCLEHTEALYRFMNLKKVRGADFESAKHQFFLEEKGIRLEATSASAAALLGPEGIRSNIPGVHPKPRPEEARTT